MVAGSVISEGRLRSVLPHAPRPELRRLTPSDRVDLLPDGIAGLERAQEVGPALTPTLHTWLADTHPDDPGAGSELGAAAR